ncbi:MAG: 1-acyl-sn-glycerol-3-phosphate acyltransferase [Actinomycetota bacterium]|nr:1-acyl-sn-glycerol-3-phosphate acyltransferase [Actinomycetota bacterium]
MPAQWDPPLIDEPVWPVEVGGPVLLLIDAETSIEHELIKAWIDRNQPADVRADIAHIPASRRIRRRRRSDPRLEARLGQHDDPIMVPIRIVWLAAERDGKRRVSLKDLLVFGDPRDPNLVRQRWTRTFHPDRIRIVVAEQARKSNLEDRWTDPTGRGPAEGTSLSEFVALKAWLALERAERALRGARYKVPKFLREDLYWSRGFQRGVSRLAIEEDEPLSKMQRKTARYLKEIAATHSPYVIDIVTALMAWILSLGYQKLEYSTEDLRELYQIGETHPLVFLPSHKSNSDHLVLQYVLYQNEFPPNHTAGGINLNFFPIGLLLRRTGIFFIRREFKTNEPYKFVLRQYVDYLLEKRFPLEWYLEGGRSRTGKLRSPRLGMLSYVVDTYLRGLVEDIVFIPVSIGYDQISDIGAYASEQLGGKKEQESFAWALRFISNLHRRYGSVHVRFGEPLSLSETLPMGTDLTTEHGRYIIPKMAFEISNRINDATAITPISLVTLALLSRPGEGLTVDESVEALEPFLDYVRQRDLPTTASGLSVTPTAVEVALEELVTSSVVSRVEGLTDVVYVIEQDQHLAAAYYRNTIIHFFVDGSILEVAVAGMLRDGTSGMEELLARAFGWRAILKFDFFFEGRDGFRDSIVEELLLECPDGIDRVNNGDLEGVFATLAPATSPAVLMPFLEAYRIVAAVIAQADPAETLDTKTVQSRALRLGRQYAAQGKISTPEALSTELFASGIALADNAGLLDDGDQYDRDGFLADIEDALEDLRTVQASASALMATVSTYEMTE